MTDGDTQAKNLLQLELDGRADLKDLARKVLSVRDGSGELASYEGNEPKDKTPSTCTYPWRDRVRADEESA